MEIDTFLPFILWFLLAESILFFARFLLRKKAVKPALRVVLIVGKALLAIGFAALVMAGPVQLRAVQPLMTALYAALLPDAAADALYSAFCAMRSRERRFSAASGISLVCGALFFVYGIVNMEVVTPKYHVFTSPKLTAEHKIVYVSDLHVGSAQPFSVTQKTVAAMFGEQPETIVLAGDITDDYTTGEEMLGFFALFRNAPCPVFYVYGNHDRQGHAEYAGGRKFTPEELEQAMRGNGIRVLKDAYAEISADLLLLGREDLSAGQDRAEIGALSNPAPEAYLITADHQPTAFRDNLAAGTDLQLSGHTHAGQLFPLGPLFSVVSYNSGEYAENEAFMTVSDGACGWRTPFRTDGHCHYEVITLKPAL